MTGMPPAAESFLIADLKEHASQSSKDWEADQRFARALGMVREARVCEELLGNPTAIVPVQMAIHQKFIYPRVTRRRLRSLRKLAQRGTVEAQWMGTEEGGRTEFGVGRVRIYRLRDAS